MKIALYIALAFLSVDCYAQDGPKLHDPSEIVKIMEASKIGYEMQMLEEKKPCKDRSNNINLSSYYQKEKNGILSWAEYVFNADEQKLIMEGERCFRDKKNDSARYYYRKALELYPDCSTLYTYIGQTFDKESKITDANIYYERAIKKNYFDYMAHWFLADNLLDKGEYTRAVDEITMATILNRNNLRIKDSRKHIFATAGIVYKDWCFTPQLEIKKIEENHISVKSDASWMGYALENALWEYEPGYKESLDSNVTLKYREALAALLVTMSADKDENWKADPALVTLKRALKEKNIQEYLYYDIVLPEYPSAVFLFPAAYLSDIKNYVLNVRSK